MQNKIIQAAAVALTIAGCGGGSVSGVGSGNGTGYFKDSNTSGLSYVSGSLSGVTGADGSFSYEAGQPVTFSIGGVTLGTTGGKPIVTPVDLVTSGSSGTASVQNIVRFLMMLDSDANPDNGLTISPAVQAAAANWTALDFASTAFDTAASAVIASVNAADTRTATLQTAIAAQAHLESTLRCSYAGAYRGNYSGSDNGSFGVMVDATTGNVSGVAYSSPNGTYTALSGTTPISYSQNVSFVSTGSGATFSGQYTSVDNLIGTWQNPSASGSFTGSRIGGALNAVYRFTGLFTSTGAVVDSGLFSIDIDSADKVTGVAYSVSDGQLLALTGTRNSSVVTASSTTGSSITGTISTLSGTLSGSWTNPIFNSFGTFTGSGCKLN